MQRSNIKSVASAAAGQQQQQEKEEEEQQHQRDQSPGQLDDESPRREHGHRDRDPHTSPRGSVLYDAIGGLVNPVVNAMDINGVVQRIDVNDVVSRVDWNAVIDEIDWNNLLNQIDMDALLDRMDVNRLVERVDVNGLVERSNLRNIVARSTSGICSIVFDRFRAICIQIDQIVQQMGGGVWLVCCCWSAKKSMWTIPPGPDVLPVYWRGRQGGQNERRAMKSIKKTKLLAQAVQGKNAGTFSRFLAYFIDQGFHLLCSTFILLTVNAVVDLVWNDNGRIIEEDVDEVVVVVNETMTAPPTESNVERALALLYPIILAHVTSFIIDAFSMAAVGRTIGKAFMGLSVVNSRKGKVGHITFCQCFLRSFLTNIIDMLAWIGACVSLIREDRRGIIDLLCCTTVIYAWDAKRYVMASDELEKESGFQFESIHLGSSYDDEEDKEESSPPLGAGGAP